MPKIMRVVAGPPGSGKSRAFPSDQAGFERHFNADDRAKDLNRGSYQSISPEIRKVVNAELERFIADAIVSGQSFTFETTLRTTITFEQARAARARGFFLYMRYLASDVETCVERVKIRADAGGHSAPESWLRATHASSLRNLLWALREMDRVVVMDTTSHNQRPQAVLITSKGRIVFASDSLPAWLKDALAGTEFES
jgi:predicted ABC-type ATPase